MAMLERLANLRGIMMSHCRNLLTRSFSLLGSPPGRPLQPRGETRRGRRHRRTEWYDRTKFHTMYIPSEGSSNPSQTIRYQVTDCVRHDLSALGCSEDTRGRQQFSHTPEGSAEDVSFAKYMALSHPRLSFRLSYNLEPRARSCPRRAGGTMRAGVARSTVHAAPFSTQNGWSRRELIDSPVDRQYACESYCHRIKHRVERR